MKKRFRSGIGFKCLIECIEYKSIVITVAAYIRDWTFITKIQDCTEIYFFFSIIVSRAIFEFAHIGYPLFIKMISMEFAVQYILCDVGRISGRLCTTVISVSDD